MRGDTDFSAAASWMAQIDDSLEPEPPRAMPSWMAPALRTSGTPLPPYSDGPFGRSASPVSSPTVSSVSSGRSPLVAPPRPAAVLAGHVSPGQPQPGRGPAAEPSIAPPSMPWGQMGSLPSLRPLVSIMPSQAPGPDAHEVAALRASLDAALAAASKARQDILEASERDLVDLALVIASRVVGRELRTDPTLVSAWVREGVASLVAEDDVSVTVSPDVAGSLGEGTGAGYRLTVDASLGPLSCVVRGRYGRVDVGAEARLRLLAEALGVPEAP
jgi:hypothetical protein